MGSKRRYHPVGKEPIYDKTFDNLRVNSRILNPGNDALSVYSLIWDAQNVRSELIQLTGNDEGMYFVAETGETFTAKIPAIQAQMKKVRQEFKQYQQEMVNRGYKPPEQMPAWIKEKMLVLEARLDVLLEEKETLEQWLQKNIEIPKEKDRKANILKNGPQGSGFLRGGVLAMLDGQKISKIGGMLVIDEEDSPYDGMAVQDYREHVMKPWIQAKNKLIKEYNEKVKNKEIDPASVPLDPRPPLPEWPQGVKNYKQQKKEKKEITNEVDH